MSETNNHEINIRVLLDRIDLLEKSLRMIPLEPAEIFTSSKELMAESAQSAVAMRCAAQALKYRAPSQAKGLEYRASKLESAMKLERARG